MLPGNPISRITKTIIFQLRIAFKWDIIRLMDKIKKLFNNFRHISEYMGRRQIATIAAATAFWFFLSIVPIVILCVSILPYTSVTEEQLLAKLAPVLTESMTELIRIILSDVYSSGAGVLSISLIATVWSSAMGFSSLIRGLEDIYEQPRRAGFLMRRARGIIYTLGMILMMVLSFVLGGFGEQIKALVEKYLPGTTSFFTFLLHFRFVVVIAVLTVFFGAIFRWSTGLRPPFGEVFPGALTAAIGWSLFSYAFSAWVNAGHYGTYGSLVTVVVVMLWLYYCQYILLLSACLNRALPKIRRKGESNSEETSVGEPEADK